jgi:uncharacterized protein DUF2203
MPHANGSPIGWSESARRSAGGNGPPPARHWLAPSAGAGAAIPDEVAADVLSLDLMSCQLNAMDVVARELARGLVDFPLCATGRRAICAGRRGTRRGEHDEPSITHRHGLDAGAAGRRAL